LDTPILKKAANYCVYQERTHQEVRKKLSEWKVFGDETEEIISWLITENYLNEERYAKAFAGGKFRVKNWGKLKINFELKARKISAYCIKSGLAEITDVEYQEKIDFLINKKMAELELLENQFEKSNKIFRHLTSKGFEPELVNEGIRKKLKL
jgi:regulatory protein